MTVAVASAPVTGGATPQPGDLRGRRDLDHRARRATPTRREPPRSRAPRGSPSTRPAPACATRPALPILFRVDASPEAARDAGADACLIVVEEHDDEEHLEELHQRARASSGSRSSSTSTTRSRSTASLERDRPGDLPALAARGRGRRGRHSSAILDLLPDVPAGKLAIADLPADHARRGARARAGRRRRRARRHGRRRPPRRWRASARSETGPPLRHAQAWAVARRARSALAAALRLVGIEYGLPFGDLLNPDEQNIVPRAWGMVHGGGLDPHWFDYPTLLLYVLAPFQAWQDEPSYLTARLVIVAVRRRRASPPPGGSAAPPTGRRPASSPARVVAVETIGVAYSHMAVTDVPMTALITVSLALAVTGRLEWAGVAAGLAASAKYPAVFLLVPLVVAGWGQWRRLGDLGRARRRRVPRDEPVRARPPAPGVERRVARAAARPRRLARLRARLVGALLVHREALGRARAGARDRRRRPRRSRCAGARAPT